MTTPKEIVIVTRLGDVDEGAIQRKVREPFVGRLYRAKLAGVFVGIIALGMVTLEFGTGLEMFSGPPIAMLYLTLFAGFCVLFAVARTQRRFHGLIVASPIRQLPIRYVLNAGGVARNGAMTPWEMIVDVQTWDEVTLLMVSPLESFPIPHSRLPEGLRPADLRRSIDQWRAA